VILVVGETKLESVTRYVDADLDAPAIVIRRERHRDGSPAGRLVLYPRAFAALAVGIAAARRGDVGIAATSPSGQCSLSFEVRAEGILAIGLTEDGEPRGGASVIVGDEIDRLAEALRIAEWSLAA
jgi:hypothetical protein